MEEYRLVCELVKRRQLYAWLIEVDSVVLRLALWTFFLGKIVYEDPSDSGLFLTIDVGLLLGLV
jgi:hypothetical protein